MHRVKVSLQLEEKFYGQKLYIHHKLYITLYDKHYRDCYILSKTFTYFRTMWRITEYISPLQSAGNCRQVVYFFNYINTTTIILSLFSIYYNSNGVYIIFAHKFINCIIFLCKNSKCVSCMLSLTLLKDC